MTEKLLGAASPVWWTQGQVLLLLAALSCLGSAVTKLDQAVTGKGEISQFSSSEEANPPLVIFKVLYLVILRNKISFTVLHFTFLLLFYSR